MLELIVISTLNGVLFGMLLFLMASGLTVIFSMLGVLNFAHASFYMLGAYLAYGLAPLVEVYLGGGFFATLVIGVSVEVTDSWMFKTIAGLLIVTSVVVTVSAIFS